MLSWLLACGGEHPWRLGEVVVDARQDFGEAPDPGLGIVMPDVIVEPYEEIIYCYFGTYTGETVGVTHLWPLEAEDYTHHNQLKTPLADTEPDGTVMDCTETGDAMGYFTPLIEAVGVTPETADEKGWLDLPDGMAMRLDQGTPWVQETHYINATDQRVLANSALQLGFVPYDEVDTWVGTFEFDSGEPIIPPDGEVSITFECAWPQDANVLSILGHMHELGVSIETEWIHEGGSEILYQVADWKPEYKSEPVIDNHAPGEVAVKEGDVFRTTCTYVNNGTETVTFPTEMCTLNGTVYPLETVIRCVEGEIYDSP